MKRDLRKSSKKDLRRLFKIADDLDNEEKDNNDVKEIERKLNDGLQRTQEEHEKCYKWLVEFMIANDLSLNELDNFCFTDKNWILDQIFN